MFSKRAEEPAPATHFRSDRFTLINGSFFFSTRENTLEGPFPNKAEAFKESLVYIERALSRNRNTATA
ncbi:MULTISPECIES: DUF6316 family protein [Pseudomonas]|uniref:DUF6316 domain-containing protein n=1 Tax=Pseudomonas quercus TaxID=2722792 RepID=A0ABX0YIJ8_9PSED|nr:MULTISPECIES: DUF6316 family protein [Pseudomonas]MBF7143503.1 hypothetical protein [Pseudomonas sp. LY10J]NJP02169.1 hypothetical protein [Pseudomonas quercus]